MTRLLVCMDGYCYWEVHFYSDSRSFDQPYLSLWKVWCLPSFQCVHFVHSSWWILFEHFKQAVLIPSFWEILMIYSFNNSLPSVFLCSSCLELLYVEFLTARVESLIFISLLFSISITPYSLCSKFWEISLAFFSEPSLKSLQFQLL